MSDSEKPKVAVVMGTGAAGLRLLTGAGAATVKDDIAQAPDISGPHGRAWRTQLEAHRRRLGAVPGKNDSSLGMWVIEAPWAHPAWHSYVIALIHLRPQADLAPAKISMPGATHEFWLWAGDPAQSRAAFIRGDINLPVLSPMNFGAQIRSSSDEAAITLIEHAIGQICAGQLNPDTDAHGQWVEMFGDSLVKPEFR